MFAAVRWLIACVAAVLSVQVLAEELSLANVRFEVGREGEYVVAPVPVSLTGMASSVGAGWSICPIADTDGVTVCEIAWKAASDSAVPSVATLTFDIPVGDIAGLWEPVNHLWTPFAEGEASKFCHSTPIRSWFADGDQNRLTLAWTECVRTVAFSPRVVIEEPGAFSYRVRLSFFTEADVPLTEWKTRIRFDRRARDWSACVQDAAKWVAAETQSEGELPPSAAFDPIYSTWYAFGNVLDASTLEAECVRAAALGMKTLITDDGWQTTHGDWDPVPAHFPDMRGHVERVHALGMKYVLWYSISFMNEKSRHYEGFKGKYLMDGTLWGQRLAIFDPRFPEVRRFIINQLAERLEKWNLDGYKIDFIDFFRPFGEDPAEKDGYAGRDYKSIPEAAHALLAEVSARLREIRPDILLEFRQPYIGPVTAKYGNMLRANDCPGDALANRVRTTDVRLTSGHAVVHSDMLRWTPSDDPTAAARSILSVIFTTVQYSMVLDTIPDAQKKVIAKWIQFAAKHRKALQNGGFRAYNPAANYPLLEGWSDEERIFAVYDPQTVVPVKDSTRRIIIINATPAKRVLVEDTAGVRSLAIAPYEAVELPRGK